MLPFSGARIEAAPYLSGTVFKRRWAGHRVYVVCCSRKTGITTILAFNEGQTITEQERGAE
jgi:hypothetical protein